MALARGVLQARRICGMLRPAAVVAFGGYPAVRAGAGGALLCGAAEC